MDRPFAPILLSIISGIIFSYFIPLRSSLILVSLFLLLLLYIFNLYRNSSNSYIIIILFFLLSSLNVNINRVSLLETYIGKSSKFIGVIHEVEEKEDDISKYIVKVKSVDNKQLNEKIVLNILGEKDFSIGDTIIFNGVLKAPSENTNPKLFDYKLYLLAERIHTTMTIEDHSINRIADKESFFYGMKRKFNDDVINLFDKYLSPVNSSLITGIILGESDFMEEADVLKYRELGLAHILAVSGLHIGIIAGFLIYLLSRIGVNRKLNIILTICTIWTYGFLIGAPASTMRACLMFTILYLSQLIHEPYDTVNSIFLSMVISLITNPYWLFNIGFQLSYMATLSIFLFTPSIKMLFYPWKSKIILSISSILAVNIGLFPITSYYFNRIQTLGIISNLISVPLLTISLIIGALMIILNYSFSFFNVVLGNSLELILTIQYEFIELLYKSPINSIKIFSPDFIHMLFYYLALGLLFNYININKLGNGIKKSIFYYLLILVSVHAIYINFDEKIEINFIDVGQGDSILIKTQGSTILMDTGGSIFGGNDIGKYITLPFLEKQGINRLDAVIITHFDADHYEGIYELLSEIEIGRIYGSYIPDDIELLNLIRNKDIQLTLLKENDLLRLDKNTTLEVLWPQKDSNLSLLSSNNRSLVSKLSYKGSDILFTGDIESEVESYLINKSIEDIDIYKVPHHGSDSSSTSTFLEKVKPHNSIISVGKNNFYSHPHEDVLKRLRIQNSNIYRTDEMGMIKIIFDNDNYHISNYLRDINLKNMMLENYALISTIVLYFLISYILIRNYDIEGEGVKFGPQ